MERDLNDYFREITQNLYSKMEERLSKYGLVKGQAQLLLLIRDNDNCTQKELANYFGVKYSSMSERIDKLETLGYICRSHDEENMKYKRIAITQQGKTIAIQCRRILNDIDKEMFNNMSKKDILQLEKYLNTIIENTKQ